MTNANIFALHKPQSRFSGNETCVTWHDTEV